MFKLFGGRKLLSGVGLVSGELYQVGSRGVVVPKGSDIGLVDIGCAGSKWIARVVFKKGYRGRHGVPTSYCSIIFKGNVGDWTNYVGADLHLLNQAQLDVLGGKRGAEVSMLYPANTIFNYGMWMIEDLVPDEVEHNGTLN